MVTEDGEFAPSFGAIATLAAADKLASIAARASKRMIDWWNLLSPCRAAYFVDKILKGAKPAARLTGQPPVPAPPKTRAPETLPQSRRVGEIIK